MNRGREGKGGRESRKGEKEGIGLSVRKREKRRKGEGAEAEKDRQKGNKTRERTGNGHNYIIIGVNPGRWGYIPPAFDERDGSMSS